LAYVRGDFSFLSQSVVKLEEAANMLVEKIKEMKDIQDKLKKINGSGSWCSKTTILLLFQ
jgi:hypothetical protein